MAKFLAALLIAVFVSVGWGYTTAKPRQVFTGDTQFLLMITVLLSSGVGYMVGKDVAAKK